MKKAEFCRSIETIRQDSELKEEILKAVEENDKVTVIRRPLFVPLLTVALVCINLGMVAKLIIFNKSQVNMSEFKARTSMSSVSNDHDSTGELIDKLKEEQKQLEKEQEKLGNEADSLRNQEEFQIYLQDVQSMLDSGGYVVVDEWSAPKANYNPVDENPYYIDFMSRLERKATNELGYYNYRRYVQQIDYVESTFERDGNVNTIMNRIWTNHEYIIGYEGDFLPENIVSITESDVEPHELSDEFIAENCKKISESQKVTNAYDNLSDNILHEYQEQKFEHTYSCIDEMFFMYPRRDNDTLGSEDSERFVQRCYAAAGNKQLFDPLKDCETMTFFYLNVNGDDIGPMLESTRINYWKDTFYLSENGAKKRVIMPNIIGMDVQEAEKALNAVGLKLGDRTYVDSYDPNINFNEISGIRVYTPNRSTLYEGDTVSVEICAQTVPQITFYTLDEAVKLLGARGLNVEIQYMDGVEKDKELLYVYTCTPYCGSPITPGSTVKIIASTLDGDTTSALVGKVISLKDNKLCSSEESQKILSGTPTSELTEIALSHVGDNEYTDTVALGRYYGDDYFKVEIIKTESNWGQCIPSLGCGAEFNSFEETVFTDIFYNSHNAQLMAYDYEDYNYLLTYEYNDGRRRFAYIKTEACEDDPRTVGFVETEKVDKICVSEYALS